MLDSVVAKELTRRKPAEGSHGTIVASILVGSELPTKIGERVEDMGIVETLLVFAMAAFHLAVVPRRIGADELMAYPFGSQGRFKQGWYIAFTV